MPSLGLGKDVGKVASNFSGYGKKVEIIVDLIGNSVKFLLSKIQPELITVCTHCSSRTAMPDFLNRMTNHKNSFRDSLM